MILISVLEGSRNFFFSFLFFQNNFEKIYPCIIVQYRYEKKEISRNNKDRKKRLSTGTIQIYSYEGKFTT